MTKVAVTTTEKKPNKICSGLSFLLALPLAAILLIHPAAMLDANSEYSHRAMMFIMIGISGGLFTVSVYSKVLVMEMVI